MASTHSSVEIAAAGGVAVSQVAPVGAPDVPALRAACDRRRQDLAALRDALPVDLTPEKRLLAALALDGIRAAHDRLAAVLGMERERVSVAPGEAPAPRTSGYAQVVEASGLGGAGAEQRGDDHQEHGSEQGGAVHGASLRHAAPAVESCPGGRS